MRRVPLHEERGWTFDPEELRAAIEDGWPGGPVATGARSTPADARGPTAIVAQAGALYRVDLFTGANTGKLIVHVGEPASMAASS